MKGEWSDNGRDGVEESERRSYRRVSSFDRQRVPSTQEGLVSLL